MPDAAAPPLGRGGLGGHETRAPGSGGGWRRTRSFRRRLHRRHDCPERTATGLGIAAATRRFDRFPVALLRPRVRRRLQMEYLTIIGAAFLAWLIIVTLFTPAIPYHSKTRSTPETTISPTCWNRPAITTLQPGNSIEILTNGSEFYPAMLEAIAKARETVNLECYIFRTGEIGERFIQALSNAHAPASSVTIVLDAIGSIRVLWRSAASAACGGLPRRIYQADALVPARPPQQPHPPRAPGR